MQQFEQTTEVGAEVHDCLFTWV